MAPNESNSGGHSSSFKSNRQAGTSSSYRGSGPRSFRGGRGGGKPGKGHRGGKKGDMGRNEYSKTKPDKRTANDESQAAKRQKLSNGDAAPLPVYATKFDEAELAAEERRPKKKVAVLIGYSGTGYRGMQLAPDQKTIEGDLFKAFVEAGAISKANADDPKKSSFVRCARTDKGVHAAGNIISLKLIVEEEDIVKKINEHLTPQIRIWGYERTNNSFSSYQLCDSRIYEYLIPTHSFLPPHPRSYLGKKCKEWAQKKGESDEWEERQDEVKGYWESVDAEVVKPILDGYPEDVREVLEKALWLTAEQEAGKQGDSETKPVKNIQKAPATTKQDKSDLLAEVKNGIEDTVQANAEDIKAELKSKEPIPQAELSGQAITGAEKPTDIQTANETKSGHNASNDAEASQQQATQSEPTEEQLKAKEARIARRKLIDDGVKRLRAAYIAAKRAYRIPEKRKDRLQEVLNLYLGTKNYWNYTVQKTYRDPSAKRVIKSFNVNMDPILIDGTEWLSLKVHGQSFMMHQIRKMVAMATLIVRCGTSPSLINTSYGPANFSIPKAPSLGLLLERPVFDSYNKRAKGDLQKEAIDFDKYTSEMDVFKQKFIYERMYQDEERENVFGNFWGHVDNFPSNTFLFVTSGGLEASGEAENFGSGANSQAVGARKTKEAEHTVDIADLDSEDELEGTRDDAGDEG